jgi:selenium metabolism protein YedF
MNTPKTLNCVNLPCPQPVIQTKNTLEAMNGNELLVIVDNEAAVANVSRFAESRGHQVSINNNDGLYHLLIKKGKQETTGAEPEIHCGIVADKKNMAVYISADIMGQGADKLGHILINAFLESITHIAREISHIILVNSGVRLAVEKSESLHHLQELEKTGVEILVCGTCLNFYNIKDQLAAGTISNMYTILETMSKADKVISP